jgi:hypothetical protein
MTAETRIAEPEETATAKQRRGKTRHLQKAFKLPYVHDYITKS